ncbi:hypothetical protein Tco_1515196 [Tanacetum coccineum]
MNELPLFDSIYFEANNRPTRAVPISTVRPLIRTHPELEILTSPAIVNLTDITLKFLPSQDGVEIELTGSSTPQQTAPVINITPPEPQVTQREGKGITTNEQPKSLPKLVPASKEVRPDPDEPIKVPYDIHGKYTNLQTMKSMLTWTKRKRSRKLPRKQDCWH